MEFVDNKKATILLILKILKNETDERHKLTQQEIINRLRKDYGIEMERKAIGRNLRMLQDAGYDVVITQKGAYLRKNIFDESELKFLMESVLASRSLDEKIAMGLLEKLRGLANKHDKDIKDIYERRKDIRYAVNEEYADTVKTLDHAIREEKVIVFDYIYYKCDKELKEEPKRIMASPYYLIVNNQKHYLIAYDENLARDDSKRKKAPVRFYRIDRIRNIRIFDNIPQGCSYTKIYDLKGFENEIDFNRLSWSFTKPYLDVETTIALKLRCKSKDEERDVVTEIVDDFGKKAKFIPGKDTMVYITCTEDAMEKWVMLHADKVSVVTPKGLAKRIKDRIAIANKL